MEMDTLPAIVFQQKIIVLEEFKSISLQAVLNKNKPYHIVTIKHFDSSAVISSTDFCAISPSNYFTINRMARSFIFR